MPTNRIPRTPQRRQRRITPQILALYRRARVLLDQGPRSALDTSDDPAVEDLYHSYIHACAELHKALGRAPWAVDVMDTLEFNRRPTQNVRLPDRTTGSATRKTETSRSKAAL